MKKLISLLGVLIICSPVYSANKYASQFINNKSSEAVQVFYTLCQFDWDAGEKKKYNTNCDNKLNFTLAPGESKDFNLNPTTIDGSKLVRYSIIYVSKIKSETKFQYFISDWDDYAAVQNYYDNRDKTLKTVKKMASFCIMSINSRKNVNIYGTSRGFVCAE